MKIEIENRVLLSTIRFMYELKLARRESRMRRRFIQLMNERLQAVQEEQKEMLKEHARKDENGEPIVLEGEKYDIQEVKAFNHDIEELASEFFVIEGSNNQELISCIKGVLTNLEDIEYEGDESEIYDYLYDQFIEKSN